MEKGTREILVDELRHYEGHLKSAENHKEDLLEMLKKEDIYIEDLHNVIHAIKIDLEK